MLALQVAEGLVIPALDIQSTLPYVELWDEDKEEGDISVPMMEVRESSPKIPPH